MWKQRDKHIYLPFFSIHASTFHVKLHHGVEERSHSQWYWIQLLVASSTRWNAQAPEKCQVSERFRQRRQCEWKFLSSGLPLAHLARWFNAGLNTRFYRIVRRMSPIHQNSSLRLISRQQHGTNLLCAASAEIGWKLGGKRGPRW